MKTGNTLKIITFALIVIALMSASAFAAVGQPNSEGESVSGITYNDRE